MRFFLDTVDPDEARRVTEWGLLDGAARPSRRRPRRREGLPPAPRRRSRRSRTARSSPRSPRGRRRRCTRRRASSHKLGKAIVIRVPMTREGLRVVRLLNDEQIADRRRARLHGRAGPPGGPRRERLRLAAGRGASTTPGRSGWTSSTRSSASTTTTACRPRSSSQGVQSPVHVLDAADDGGRRGDPPLRRPRQLFDHPLTATGRREPPDARGRRPAAGSTDDARSAPASAPVDLSHRMVERTQPEAPGVELDRARRST